MKRVLDALQRRARVIDGLVHLLEEALLLRRVHRAVGRRAELLHAADETGEAPEEIATVDAVCAPGW